MPVYNNLAIWVTTIVALFSNIKANSRLVLAFANLEERHPSLILHKIMADFLRLLKYEIILLEPLTFYIIYFRSCFIPSQFFYDFDFFVFISILEYFLYSF